MKTRLNFVRSLTCTSMILPVISLLSLQAQDYQITFAGSGGSTTVDSVIVENLTQGTLMKMKGSEVLHLKGTTGIETISSYHSDKISFYPNPMKDYSRMQFVLPEQGEATITLIDLSGRIIALTRDLLSKGQHIYAIQGVEEGVYFMKINSGSFSLSGKLISSGLKNGNAKIAHESSAISREKQNDSKGTNEEKVMQYNTGDRLKLMGKSGIYSTVITDVPTASKTITYEFIACTDGDGNNYPVIQTGAAKGTTDNPDQATDKGVQIWMGENLKTTKYNDNTAIPNVIDGFAWAHLGYAPGPAYCWFNNNITNKDIYGALYNWYAVNTSKLCPTGWHVPMDAEWTVLIDYMGGENVAGGKLKETGTSHWNSPNEGATDESGFTARPGGARDNDSGYFGEIGISSRFSSSTANYGYVMYNTSNAAMVRNPGSAWGLSVRCLKD